MLKLKEVLQQAESESAKVQDKALEMHVYVEVRGDAGVYSLKEVKTDDFGGVVFVIQQL